jgi:hypothetical protein
MCQSSLYFAEIEFSLSRKALSPISCESVPPQILTPPLPTMPQLSNDSRNRLVAAYLSTDQTKEDAIRLSKNYITSPSTLYRALKYHKQTRYAWNTTAAKCGTKSQITVPAMNVCYTSWIMISQN